MSRIFSVQRRSLMDWIINKQHWLWTLFLFYSIVYSQDIEEANTVLMQRTIIESHSDVALSVYPNIDLEHIRSVKVASAYMKCEFLIKDLMSTLGTAAWEQCLAGAQYERNVLNYFYKMWKLSELADDVRVQTICSIGFDMGVSSLALLESNPTARLIVFDTFDHAYAPVAARRIQELFPRRKVSILVGDSARSVPHIAEILQDSGVLCNLVYVDGGHTSESLLYDLKNVLRVVDPLYHRVIVDGLEDPGRADIWRELTTMTWLSNNQASTDSNSTIDDCESVFTEVEMVASKRYDCISWDSSQGKNGEYIFDFHVGRCPISANSSIMGVGFFHPSLTTSSSSSSSSSAAAVNNDVITANTNIKTCSDTSSSCTSTKKAQKQGLVQSQGLGQDLFRPEFVLYVVGENDKANDVRYNGGLVRSSVSQVGISGTDSSAIITMEMIAAHHPRRGVSRFFYQATHVLHDTVYRDVHYIDHVNASLAAKVGHTPRLNIPYVTMATVQRRMQPIAIAHVHFSEWSKEYARRVSDPRSWDIIEHHLFIPNPVFWDMIDIATTTAVAPNTAKATAATAALGSSSGGRGRGSGVNDRIDWVFHSRFERGGALSLKVFCQLANQQLLPANTKFRVMDYFVDLKNNGNHKAGAVVHEPQPSCPGIDIVGSTSKAVLYQHLSRSKYFVYLLVFPGTFPSLSYVHKDMFPVAVLEAILLGVRVVTLPMGPLLALFERDRLVDFVPIHDLSLRQRLQNYHNDTREPSLLQEDFQKHVASFIVSLDQEDFTIERKRRIEVAGRVYSQQIFTQSWLDALEVL